MLTKPIADFFFFFLCQKRVLQLLWPVWVHMATFFCPGNIQGRNSFLRHTCVRWAAFLVVGTARARDCRQGWTQFFTRMMKTRLTFAVIVALLLLLIPYSYCVCRVRLGLEDFFFRLLLQRDREDFFLSAGLWFVHNMYTAFSCASPGKSLCCWGTAQLVHDILRFAFCAKGLIWAASFFFESFVFSFLLRV